MSERSVPPKTEEQKRYEALPNNVVKYLDICKSIANPLIPEDSRVALKLSQFRTFNSFDEKDLKSLVGFMVWRQEQAIKDQGRQGGKK